ncbi:MAG: hypothetical protein ABH826_00355 [Patescibacteria group bacterium]|nr:hypothetical protein [Patescibacteria group bacterium]
MQEPFEVSGDRFMREAVWTPIDQTTWLTISVVVGLSATLIYEDTVFVVGVVGFMTTVMHFVWHRRSRSWRRMSLPTKRDMPWVVGLLLGVFIGYAGFYPVYTSIGMAVVAALTIALVWGFCAITRHAFGHFS